MCVGVHLCVDVSFGGLDVCPLSQEASISSWACGGGVGWVQEGQDHLSLSL